MSSHRQKHMNAVASEKFTADLDILFYAHSNEKLILTEKLKHILANQHFHHAIDLGAGPGLVASVLNQQADHLTLVEIKSDYYEDLKKAFPAATIHIGSLLEFEFKESYDLILLSHVLYYIAINEWENILKKLYAHLTPGGKLIVAHAPCHHIQSLFKDNLPQTQIAYLDQASIDNLMNQIGPYQKDFYLSESIHFAESSLAFAKQYIHHFYSLDKNCPPFYKDDQLQELLSFFEKKEDKLSLTYHSDLYVFNK